MKLQTFLNQIHFPSIVDDQTTLVDRQGSELQESA